MSNKIFDLEKTVIDLANAFNGIEGLTIEYDFVKPEDLTINLIAK